MIEFTTTGSALPTLPRKLRRLRHRIGRSLAMHEARRDGLLLGLAALVLLIAALVYASASIAEGLREFHARRAEAARDPRVMINGGPEHEPCLERLPFRKAHTLADLRALCTDSVSPKGGV